MAARSRHLPALRSAHGNGLPRSRLKLHQSHTGGVRDAVPVHAPGRVASARAGVLPRKRCGGGGGGPGAQPLRGASAAPPETGFRAAALFSQACHGVQEFWSRQMQQCQCPSAADGESWSLVFIRGAAKRRERSLRPIAFARRSCFRASGRFEKKTHLSLRGSLPSGHLSPPVRDSSPPPGGVCSRPRVLSTARPHLRT